MSGSATYYCPITGKKVTIKTDKENIKTFDPKKRDNSLYGKGICDGNCIGCTLI